MICVECGSEVEKLKNGLCSECYFNKNASVDIEDPIEIDICSRCGSVKKGKEWIERADLQTLMLDRIEDALSISSSVDRYSFQVGFDESDPKNIHSDIDITLLSDEAKVEKHLTTNIVLKKTQCRNCSQREGNYYEAIVQVRPTEKKMAEEVKKKVSKIVHERIDGDKSEKKNVFITAEEEIHGGLDFYLSDRRVSKNLSYDIADEFGGLVTTSSELAGREDGQNVYRMTYSVRLPPYEKGDFVEYEKKIYKIKKIKSGNRPAVVYDIKKNKSTTINRKELEEAKIHGGEELVKKAVVVSEDKREIKVLDPDTYETKTLLKPEGFSGKKEEVSVVKIKDRLFIISDEGN